MKEISRKSSEYYLPLEVDPKERCFGFLGFVYEEDKLFIDLSYTRWNKNQGLILRTAVSDGYSYKVANQVVAINDDYSPKYLNEMAEYDRSLYDPKVVRLWNKRLNLEQISTFASLVNREIRNNGLENVSQEEIFSNKDIRETLELDLENSVKNPSLKTNIEPEFV